MQPSFFESRPDSAGAVEETVQEGQGGLRLDVYLAEQIEDASRSFVKKLIKDGCVAIDGQVCTRPSRIMSEGESVTVNIPPPPSTEVGPEDIPLDILYQDDALLIVNKPAGLVVHPAPGHYTGTLVNAVLYHCPDFQRSGEDFIRPGIVHRLDRDTSGVMVVAKTPTAFTHLGRQAHDHAFDRRYVALVRGNFVEDGGRIQAAVGRSMTDRKRMAVTGLRGREAVTHFRVKERFGVASLIALELETGRTHQIRVHLRFAGHPVLGDPTYGVAEFDKWVVPDTIKTALAGLQGQALHAELLGITHPVTGERMTFTAPPPADFQAALEALRGYAAGAE